MTNEEELKKCVNGKNLTWIGECPNMKGLPSSFCDDCDRYECQVCGQKYKTYDDEMK